MDRVIRCPGPKHCALQCRPSGHNHVVLMVPTQPQELWQLVWKHQAQVLVSLCPLDTQDEVKGCRTEQVGFRLGMGRASVL